MEGSERILEQREYMNAKSESHGTAGEPTSNIVLRSWGILLGLPELVSAELASKSNSSLALDKSWQTFTASNPSRFA